MKTSLFNYHLPKERIAQEPKKRRSDSRLMAVNKKTGAVEIKKFTDIVSYFKPSDVLVLNDTKVFPARLLMKKNLTSGKIEIFLLKPIAPYTWQCLIGGKRRKDKITCHLGKIQAAIIKKNPDHTWIVRFNLGGQKFMREVFKVGQTPTPPYIKKGSVAARYQTIYARRLGSVAAPTAGFHFTRELLKKIKKKGVKILFVTLHVGLGTFEPIKSKNIEDHKLHSEFCILDSATAKQLNQAVKNNQRIVAVGTTSVRVLEGLIQKGGYRPLRRWIDAFIYPGYKFRAVQAMITNFHLPQSSLIVLVSAFAGRQLIMKAYEQAIRKKMRFYSFGDAMFIYG